MSQPNQSKGTEILSDGIDILSHATVNNGFLKQLKEQPLNHEEWILFLRRRYGLSIPFAGLVQQGVKRAGEIGEESLLAALTQNLNEEMGMDGRGLGAHGQWRQHFYEQFEVTQSNLIQSLDYDRLIERLKRDSNPYPLIGGILYMEGHLPGEFRVIRDALIRDFPKKALNLRYLNHHITYDQNHHIDLLGAVAGLAQEEEARANMMRGANALFKAKIDFYRSATKAVLEA